MRQFSHLFKWVRIPVSLCAIIWVVYQIKTHESWYHLPEDAESFIQIPLLAAISILLVFVNLSLEGMKWNISVKQLEITQAFKASLKAVLVGLGLGLWVPGRIGEFPGRLSQLPKSIWISGGIMISIGRVSQMLASLSCFGFMWLVITPPEGFLHIPSYLPPLLVILAWIGLILIKTLNPRLLAGTTSLHKIFHSFLTVPIKVWGRLIGLSFGRYLVFSLQYVLLLWAMGLTENWLELGGMVSLIFGIRAFLPSLAFADIGIRESVAVAVAQWMGVPIFPVLMATLILFIVNLVIPALIGIGIFWLREEESDRARKMSPSVG